jgi:hypothetical protein
MNDMAHNVRYFAAQASGLSRCGIDAVNRQLRRTPYNRGDYFLPIDLVTQSAAQHRLND